MKFYSKEISKPNSILEELRDGIKIVDRKCLCTFYNGELETNDPELIKKLQKHPDLFRTDRPWQSKINWKITEEGIKLLKQGERLGIDCRHIRKEYLMKLIEESKPKVKEVEEILPEPETVEIKEIEKEEEIIIPKLTTPVVKIDYQEIIRKAKAKGIKTHGVKKNTLIEELKKREEKLKEKEVI